MAGTTPGKTFGIVSYILLGLFVLLTVMFVVELLKFRQMSGEMKDLKDDITEQLARMKEDLMNKIESESTRLLEGQRNIGNRISSSSDQMHIWHSNLQSQMADVRDNCLPKFECPNQWTLFGQKCYYFSPSTKDWLSSQMFCLSEMGNLAVIDRSDKQAFVRKEVKSTRHWIGLNESITDGAWLWVDGTDFSASQKFWSAGEPRNTGSYESCVGTNRDGNWAVYSCHEKMNFICERSVFCNFK
ncbi:hepatic lectin-like isoform X2 [Narcine bancroftii]